jgi:hypothetical protein
MLWWRLFVAMVATFLLTGQPTERSAFIISAPEISNEKPCSEGFKREPNGRCRQVFEVNRSRYLEFCTVHPNEIYRMFILYSVWIMGSLVMNRLRGSVKWTKLDTLYSILLCGGNIEDVHFQLDLNNGEPCNESRERISQMNEVRYFGFCTIFRRKYRGCSFYIRSEQWEILSGYWVVWDLELTSSWFHYESRVAVAEARGQIGNKEEWECQPLEAITRGMMKR